MPFHQHIAAVAMGPVMRNPNRAGVRRIFIVAGMPPVV
jgi:hypothetical protein